MGDPEIPKTYPSDPPGIDPAKLADCIEACLDCAQTCTACADACLREETVADLATCIRAALDCADICEATGRLLSRHAGQDTNLARAFLDTCATACKVCGEECAKHAQMHEHCRACAEACRRCELACNELLAVLG